MRIAIIENKFLYQVKDIETIKKQENYGTIYQYQKHFYFEIKKKIPMKYYLNLLEWSNILYKENTEIIIKKGKKLKTTINKSSVF